MCVKVSNLSLPEQVSCRLYRRDLIVVTEIVVTGLTPNSPHFARDSDRALFHLREWATIRSCRPGSPGPRIPVRPCPGARHPTSDPVPWRVPHAFRAI